MNKTFYADVQTMERLSFALECHDNTAWAKILGVHRHAVQHYREGSSQIRMSQLKTICKESGVSADWILGLEGEVNA